MTRRLPKNYSWNNLLFDETILNRHFTERPSRKIKFVVVHHMVIKDQDPNADDALDKCFDIWQTRKASAHYGVDGKFVRQFVWDKDVAWASGTTSGNEYGLHIEHANSSLDEVGTSNDYKVAELTWKNGAKLAAHLHLKYGLGRPVANVTLRKHSSFKATACPGPFIDKIWDQYVAEAQRVYDEITKPKTPKNATVVPETYKVKRGDTLKSIGHRYGLTVVEIQKLNDFKKKPFRVGATIRLKRKVKKTNKQIAREVLAGKWGNAPTRAKKLKAEGYNPEVIQRLVNQLSR